MARQPGDAEKLLATITRLHNAVRDVAILMCQELGVEPHEQIRVPSEDTSRLTPYELAHYRDFQLPISGSINSRDELGKITIARWETFRWQASMALAGWRAVTSYALTSENA